MNINTINNIIRYVLSVCFILSGSLKAAGLRAFEQEVQLYGDAYVGGWVHDYAYGIAIAVCASEFAVGVAALWRRFALTTGMAFLAMLIFFVYLTGTNLFFPTMMGSIETCGCFGELVHFTPVSSFVKSTVLAVMAAVNLYFILKTERVVARTGRENKR